MPLLTGLNSLVRAGQDLLRPRNMVIVALIIFGVGGMQVSMGGFKLAGIGLAAVTGGVLNLLLPQDLACFPAVTFFLQRLQIERFLKKNQTKLHSKKFIGNSDPDIHCPDKNLWTIPMKHLGNILVHRH